MFASDSQYFLDLQTQTGWGQTLYGFATWCTPQPGWLTLDVGCGPGLLPAILTKFGCFAMGIDLDFRMFKPLSLHPIVVVADVNALPCKPNTFDLITASNLVFLLPEPIKAMANIKRLLRPGGKLAMLNPSEFLNLQSAVDFAKEKSLEGLARETLLNWAQRAEEYYHWTDDATRELYAAAEMKYQGSVLKIGPGFGRFSSGIV